MISLGGFSRQEKVACLPVVGLILEAARVARSRGVLALEDWAQSRDNDFLRFLIGLVVDGTDPENRWLMKSKLFAMLGEQFIVDAGFLDDENGQTELDAQLAVMAKQVGITGSEPFNAMFEMLSDRDKQQVLRETDMYHMIFSVRGCNVKVAVRLFSNCSRRFALTMLEASDMVGDVSDEQILFAQK